MKSRRDQIDLNQLKIPSAAGSSSALLSHNSTSSEDGQVTVYFRDLQQKLLEQIAEADVVLGCVAWLTSFEVLKALAQKRGVSIIVQKEDFLRPDQRPTKDWLRNLKALYGDLYPTLTRRDIGGVLAEMRGRQYRTTAEELAKEWFIEDPMDPIRCVGIVGGEQERTNPRMHNKYLIFAHFNEGEGVSPYAVWTGSYNLSATAERSFENALLLRNPNIVRAYFFEYGQIAALSEPLDWKSKEVNPEWWRGAESDWSRFDPLAGES